jgi:hypothetical protein
MEISLRHHFDCTPGDYWVVIHDPGYEAELHQHTDVDLTTLSSETRDGKLYERLRVSPRKELPAIAAKAVGASRLSYVQELVSDPVNHTITWKVLSDVLPDKVTCSGTTVIRPDGAGCVRDLRGEVRVALPFVGGTIEKHIVTELESSYTRAADVVRRLLAKRS